MKAGKEERLNLLFPKRTAVVLKCFTAFVMTPILILSSSSISSHAFFKPLYFVGALRPSHSLLL